MGNLCSKLYSKPKASGVQFSKNEGLSINPIYQSDDDDKIINAIQEVITDEELEALGSIHISASDIVSRSENPISTLASMVQGLNMHISMMLPIEFALRCLCKAFISYSKDTDIGQMVNVLLQHDTRALENGINVLRSVDLNTASDALDEVVMKIPRLIELKENNDANYDVENGIFRDLVQTLLHDAKKAFNTVEYVNDQIRAVQLHCIALILSNSTGERDTKMIRAELGVLMNKMFSIPRIRSDIHQILSGKKKMMDFTNSMKSRLRAALFCLLHVEKFNLSNNLPFVFYETVQPTFSIKSIMEFGLLGASTVDDLEKLNEFSEQEMVVIEGLMETKRSAPSILSAFSFTSSEPEPMKELNSLYPPEPPAGTVSGNSGDCVMTYSGHTDCVNAVCMVNGKQFVSGSEDRTLKLWNVDSSTAVMTYSGHSGSVYAVCMVNAKQFVSGSDDRTLKLWNV